MIKQAKGGNLGFSQSEKPDFPEENPISPKRRNQIPADKPTVRGKIKQ